MAMFHTLYSIADDFCNKGIKTQIHALQKTEDPLEKSEKADLNSKMPWFFKWNLKHMAGLPVHPLSPLNDKDKPDTKHKCSKPIVDRPV